MREKALMAVVGVIAMYAFAAALWFMYSAEAWKSAAKTYNRAKDTYQREVKLIGEKRKWNDAYETEKAAMPTFGEGKATDTTWRRKLDEFAAKHHIVISSAQTGREIEAGDVLELPIDVKGWEGSLEALVRLMHELENTSDGMFDITQLNFKPSSKKGYLRGSFTLNCAYMREK
ncbi:MAG: hypothetical protein J6T01_03505 [Kiritimatiellae bacterium]|nr:hypothetical protein [Kiritimatiellia bacterium]